MSGRSEKSTHLSLEPHIKTLSDCELANALKRFFTCVNSNIPPLDLSVLGDMLPMVQRRNLIWVKYIGEERSGLKEAFSLVQ